MVLGDIIGWMYSPKGLISNSHSPTPQDVTLFQNNICCGRCNSLRWGHTGVGWGLNNDITNITDVLSKRGNLDMHMGECHVRMKAGIYRHTIPQKTKNHQKLEEDISPHSPQKESTLPTLWFWTSRLQSCEAIHAFFSNHPCFVILLQHC
jgi:hypothetical protein